MSKLNEQDRQKFDPPLICVSMGKEIKVYILSRSNLQSGQGLKVMNKEQEISARISNKRRRVEFLASRWLFHRVSKSRRSLLRKENGAPLWPRGFSGSITHRDGHVAVAIINEELINVGLDLERTLINPMIAKKILQPAETALCKNLEQRFSELHFEKCLALMFSCKESLFKALSSFGVKYFRHVVIEDIKFDRRLKSGTIKINVLINKENHCHPRVKFKEILLDDQAYFLVYTILSSDKKSTAPKKTHKP